VLWYAFPHRAPAAIEAEAGEEEPPATPPRRAPGAAPRHGKRKHKPRRG